MNDFCHRVLEHFWGASGLGVLHRDHWYLVSGKAGPNAVLKMVIPPSNGDQGYVLTIARHRDTPVVRHEVGILTRLRHALPNQLCGTVPMVLAHGRVDEREYFAMPFYRSFGHHRIVRRLSRSVRAQWGIRWATELGHYTLGASLSRDWLEAQYADTIARVERDPAVSDNVKRRLKKSFQAVLACASDIPSVCCHGDFWAGNILWESGFRNAVVLDWGAARWPGLPGVDLCRYALGCLKSDRLVREAIVQYCRTVRLDPALVPSLYDLYNVFVKSELDLAFATQPHLRFDPFTAVGLTASQRLAQLNVVRGTEKTRK